MTAEADVPTPPDAAPARGSRFDPRDVLGESVAGVFSRPGRSVLTILGTVLGVGALVATLGVAQTAGGQIVRRFDALAATHVVAAPAAADQGFGERVRSSIPWDAEDRLTRLNGVVAAGTLTTVATEGALVRSVPINDPLGLSEFQLPVHATSPGLFGAVKASLLTGRTYDQGHSERADRVAVLGPAAAQRLNVNRVDHQPAIFVGDEMFIVIGIIEQVAREPGLLGAVLIPDGAARAVFDLAAPGEVQIDTEVGAAQLIASQAATALDPNSPERIRVRAPSDPSDVRDAVQADVNALFLLLGGVSLLVGAIGIANVTLVSVLERVGEIGLRRTFGARKRHIAVQFLTESTMMGLLGGILGASAGVLVVVGVAFARQWTPVLDLRVPLAATVLGAAVGLVAGLYPSLRAAGMEPVDALRQSA